MKIKDSGTGDIIKFYNEVYIEQVKAFVFCLTGSQKEEAANKKIVEEMWVQDGLCEFVSKHRLADPDQWMNEIKAKAVYVFGKSSSKKLEKITALLAAESFH